MAGEAIVPLKRGSGAMMDEHNAERDHAADTEAAKKPYEKPAFRFERIFETMALACGKVYGTQHICQFNRKSS